MNQQLRPSSESTSSASPWASFRRVAILLGLLYCFLVGLDLMGLAFKLFGKGFAEQLIATTANPFVGLLFGILATSLVQSSSTTTSMIVGLVAAGALNIQGAIPMIMGANIGTSVTNTLVSLAHVTRPEEFRRAFAGATLHDFFNWMSVLILLPLEIVTGFLRHSAEAATEVLIGSGGGKLFNPLKAIVRPVAEGIRDGVGKSGVLVLILGILAMIFALRFLVVVLKQVFTGRAERLLNRTLFRSAFSALVAGAVMTVMVQSSSITTSVVIPLVGAGVVTLERLFPFTIGANIGTTVTALLAALATGNPAAITVALSHLFFNLTGTLLIYPVPFLRAIPLTLARAMGNLAVRSRVLAGVYILVMFFGLPASMLLFTGGEKREVPEVPPVTAPTVIDSPAPAVNFVGALTTAPRR
ncbi:MAG: Na/Pi symporter [Deltaproteobacteria bacterium]|nr:Na/Pi symporter [Deltaproteobacteria bacterium]